jgi:hypothetical protein
MFHTEEEEKRYNTEKKKDIIFGIKASDNNPETHVQVRVLSS